MAAKKTPKHQARTAKPKAPLVDESKLAKRVNLRLSWRDYQKLLELRLTLRFESDAQTIRSLIRLSHSAHRTELGRAQRDPGYLARLQDLRDRARQLDLLGIEVDSE